MVPRTWQNAGSPSAAAAMLASVTCVGASTMPGCDPINAWQRLAASGAAALAPAENRMTSKVTKAARIKVTERPVGMPQ
jgi:hypothetical protein